MLKLVDITKEYIVEEEHTLALHNVSIEFRKNEFVSILGPSGCGKTTLLNIVGGLDRYTSGDIQIDGVSTKKYDDIDWDTYRNRRIGFVFQSYNLIPHMNVLKNVALCLTLAGVGKDERKERALEALRKVGLEGQARKKPMQMSGGQMQRVAIARALVNNPDIILADEPTGALDTESGIQIMELLKEVAKDRLVIMVTHNPQLADEYSTRIVYLKDGELVGDSMPYDSEQETAEAADNAQGVEICEIKEDEIKGDSVNDEMNSAEEAIDVTVDDAATENDAADKNSVADETDSIGVAADGEVQPAVQEKGNAVTKRVRAASKWMMRHLKRREKEKSSMKLSTAVSLSWNNLISKKGRTILTSVAGSIGIIGIILVLSLSNGASKYIDVLEENALSQYPLTINESNMDLSAIMSMLMSDDSQREKYPESETIYTTPVLGKVLGNIKAMLQKNDLYSLKKYIEGTSEYGPGTAFDKSLATVKYDYGTTFNVYADDPKNAERIAAGEEAIYMKVSPYTETMNTVFNEMPDFIKNLTFSGMSITDALAQFATMMGDSWSEMSTNQKLLDQQYEIVGGKWPSSAEEIVIVVDEKNQLIDYQLFMLGLKSQDDVLKALDGESFSAAEFAMNELLGKEYKVLTNADYFDEDPANPGKYVATDKTEQSKAFVESHSSITTKVVGVIRPKAGVAATSITGVIGYTNALAELLIEKAESHPAVVAQLAAYEAAVAADQNKYESVLKFDMKLSTGDVKSIDYGTNVKTDDTGHTELMRALGVVDTDYPKAILFYCASFESKDSIVEYINKYNVATESNVKHSDNLSIIMGFVNTMTTTITGVLVGFAAISLIVSTIMIAIIIYTSVLERRKEIGVLRSIGARKKDISRVFLAESAILGGYSGLIGLFFSYLISLAGSAILRLYFQIDGLMTITWWHCVMMLGISVLLSMFAGFIPSRIAARKDPAIALRSE